MVKNKNNWFWFGILSAIIILNAAMWSFAAPVENRQGTLESGKDAVLTIRTTAGEIYGFFGELTVVDSGSTGNHLDLELDGWMVGYDGEYSAAISE